MVIGLATKLVKTITLAKVLVWSIALIIGIAGYTAFERRADLFDVSILSGPVKSTNEVGHAFTISKRTEDQIKEMVNNDKDIVGLGVFSADLRLNIRKKVYLFATNTANDTPEQKLATLNAVQLPLFTKNEENNRQIVKLINGEFSCVPYSTTILAKTAPILNRTVVSVCRASLPPYYGYFSGFLTIYLTDDPDVERQLRLKSALETLAAEIYFKDVIPTSKKIELRLSK